MGVCMSPLVLVVNRLAGLFCLNLKATSARPFCSSKIHCCGGVVRRSETYWKTTLTISL
jgi:hypothetical protein